MEVIADTNVLISATFWSGASFKLLNLIDGEKIACVLSKEIQNEYYRTATSDEIIDKVKNKGLIVREVVERVISKSKIVEPKFKLKIVEEDPDDDKILEAAVEGGVDFIITYDKHLLKLKEFRRIKIVKPEEFLKVLE